jgi:hypothetical protein
MPAIPKITLRHKKTGAIQSVNLSDFNAKGEDWSNWGPAGKEPEVKGKVKSAGKGKKRAHDDDGHFASDDPSTPDVNEAFEPEAPTESAPVATAVIDPTWKKMKWVDRRKYVQKITGSMPNNMVEAEELMAAFE